MEVEIKNCRSLDPENDEEISEKNKTAIPNKNIKNLKNLKLLFSLEKIKVKNMHIKIKLNNIEV